MKSLEIEKDKENFEVEDDLLDREFVIKNLQYRESKAGDII